MLIDTHCHLDSFSNIDRVLEQAKMHAVEGIVAVSENPETMCRALQLQANYEGRIWAGLGLHPAWVIQNKDTLDNAIDWLKKHIGEASVLGEVGLDYKWAGQEEQRYLQIEVLEIQLDLAGFARKPVSLHSRRCLRQTLECAVAFKHRTGLNAHMHWFTESKKLVRICNDEGIYVSVGPTILASEQAQAVAQEIETDLLLFETDAPVVVGGVSGHPQRVRVVAEHLAMLLGVSWHELAEQTTENFFRFIGKEPA